MFDIISGLNQSDINNLLIQGLFCVGVFAFIYFAIIKRELKVRRFKNDHAQITNLTYRPLTDAERKKLIGNGHFEKWGFGFVFFLLGVWLYGLSIKPENIYYHSVLVFLAVGIGIIIVLMLVFYHPEPEKDLHEQVMCFSGFAMTVRVSEGRGRAGYELTVGPDSFIVRDGDPMALTVSYLPPGAQIYVEFSPNSKTLWKVQRVSPSSQNG
jgi:MFS family permease